jgi:hypothetical protein
MLTKTKNKSKIRVRFGTGRQQLSSNSQQGLSCCGCRHAALTAAISTNHLNFRPRSSFNFLLQEVNGDVRNNNNKENDEPNLIQ